MKRRDWHPEDVKAAVRKTGVTLRHLSEAAGYSRSVCARALAIPHAAAQAVIASHLAMLPQDIWPSRYDAAGNPKQGLHSRHHKARKRGPHTQKSVLS